MIGLLDKQMQTLVLQSKPLIRDVMKIFRTYTLIYNNIRFLVTTRKMRRRGGKLGYVYLQLPTYRYESYIRKL